VQAFKICRRHRSVNLGTIIRAMPHVTFIHGISNQPRAEPLLDLWRRSLADGDGIDLGAEGVTSSMVYWADVMYAEPLSEAAAESAGDEAAVEALASAPPDLGLAGMDDGERLWVARLAATLAVPLAADGIAEAAPSAGAAATAAPETAEASPARAVLERIPLPWAVKEPIMRKLLRDVHHYLWNVEHSPRQGTGYRVQDEIRGRVLRALDAGAAQPPPHVVICHSMGTVIAYDCLRRVAAAPAIDGLMTVGSPLGLDEIQDKLRPEWNRDDGFPMAKLRGRWVNVYDRLDPVAGFDPYLANDYRAAGEAAIHDLNEQSYGAWRHDMRKYLAGPELRGRLREMLGL
jgi:hypothetical protein